MTRIALWFLAAWEVDLEGNTKNFKCCYVGQNKPYHDRNVASEIANIEATGH